MHKQPLLFVGAAVLVAFFVASVPPIIWEYRQFKERFNSWPPRGLRWYFIVKGIKSIRWW